MTFIELGLNDFPPENRPWPEVFAGSDLLRLRNVQRCLQCLVHFMNDGIRQVAQLAENASLSSVAWLAQFTARDVHQARFPPPALSAECRGSVSNWPCTRYRFVGTIAL